jgi:hypothetical protein
MSRKEAQNRKGVKRNAHSTLLAGKIDMAPDDSQKKRKEKKRHGSDR